MLPSIRKHFASASLFLICCGVCADAQTLTPVDFSAQANARLQNFPEPMPYVLTGGIFLPDALTGNMMLGGIPFFIPTNGNVQGNNAWNAFNATGSNPRFLEISTSIAHPVKVYTLLNTYWGVHASDSYASIEFYGSNGAYYKKDLAGGEDIRNYNAEPPETAAWAQTINGTTTTQALVYDTLPNGLGQRLDRQEFTLPGTFFASTLLSIRLIDTGRDFDPVLYDAGDRAFQRLILSGITVASGVAESTTVSGTIALQSSANEAQLINFTFRPVTGSTFTRNAVLTTTGVYSLADIPSGEYIVSVKGAKWLRKNITVDARLGSVINANAALLAGDANNDNAVDVADLLLVINHYNQTQANNPNGYLEGADFNGDGVNDVTDLLTVIGNYNKQGDS